MKRYRAAATEIRWPVAVAVVRHVGYLVIFAASAIHLTNMRFTPLIYFKF